MRGAFLKSVAGFVAVASVSVAAAGGPTGLCGSFPMPVVLDGDLSDWSGQQAQVLDAWGDAQGTTDVTLLAGRRIGEHIVLRLGVVDVANLHKPGPDGGLRITISTDEESVTVDTGNRWAEVNGDPVPWGAVDYLGLPTHGADEYEIRVRVKGGDARVEISGSDALDEPLVITGSEEAVVRDEDQVRGDVPLRVVVWNVLHGGGFGDPERRSEAQQIFDSLDADVLLLQEVWRVENFAQRVKEICGAEWEVYEVSGVAVASKHPLTLLSLEPDVELDDRRRPVGGDTWSVMRNLFVGVDSPVGPVVMVSAHWKCCGEMGSDEDITRMDDAMTALKSIWRLRDSAVPARARRDGSMPYKADVPERFADAPILFAGDYNLVGSRAPLDMLLTQGFVDLMPIKSDEWAAYTWRSPRDERVALGGAVDSEWRPGGFPSGRLDLTLADRRFDVERSFIADMGELTLISDHLPIVVDINSIDGE